MSKASAELIEELVAAWNRRDLVTILELTDPDVEYVNAPIALEPGTRRGHDAISDVFRKQWEGLADAQMEIVRTQIHGGELFTEAHIGRSMPGSDVRVDSRLLFAWTIDGGRVMRLRALGSDVTFDSLLEPRDR